MALENKSMDRILNIGDGISPETVKDIITEIYKINYDDELKFNEFKVFERKPIQLLINTHGGQVYDGLALINAILQSKTEIHTLCVGIAMSMGLFILLSGHKSYVYKYSTLMYHEVSQMMCDKMTGIKQDLKEGERLQSILDNIILSKSSVLKEKLDTIKSLKQEWFITPEEALKLNLIDGIK